MPSKIKKVCPTQLADLTKKVATYFNLPNSGFVSQLLRNIEFLLMVCEFVYQASGIQVIMFCDLNLSGKILTKKIQF